MEKENAMKSAYLYVRVSTDEQKRKGYSLPEQEDRLLRYCEPIAIDQPIDFDVPESIVMLAVYLSIPEAENSRRGRNASDGMRRARKMGRWPGRAPMGYVNQSTQEGNRIIVPKQSQADLIKWALNSSQKLRFPSIKLE